MIFAVTEKGEAMVKDICEECESVFEHKGKAFICPACHKKRLSRYAKERNLNKLGNAAYSKKCAIHRAERKENNE